MSTTTLLANLPELGTLTGKQIAALVGVAPLNRDSGTWRGKRTVWGGRAQSGRVVYGRGGRRTLQSRDPCVLSTPLCGAGKAKKVALTACMRKLLMILMRCSNIGLRGRSTPCSMLDIKDSCYSSQSSSLPSLLARLGLNEPEWAGVGW